FARQKNAGAAQLGHRGLKANARAKGGFFKDHAEDITHERGLAFAAAAGGFQLGGARQQPLQLGAIQFQKTQEVLHRRVWAFRSGRQSQKDFFQDGAALVQFGVGERHGGGQ